MNISNVTSRYDFNLVEFPIFVFAKKGEGKHIKEIVYRDTISGKNGETVERVWTVLPDSKYGFGSETTLSTLYDLFQIWSAADFEDKKIKFGTINNLLKMRGIAYADKQDYQRVLRDLYCLQGINIDTKNAFWDNDKKAYVDLRLHLFVSLYLYRAVGRRNKYDSPYSYIVASDEFYGSVQKNTLILDFGREFFHSLTPIEQRLALYLSKIFRSQTLHRKSIIELARQIPLYQKETRNIKQELIKALVHRDGASGESSMYGILQSTANENGYKGNIKDITVEYVKAIYRKIWEKSGASSLPPALSVVHFDTYVNNPAMAKKLLNRSKGDINIYLKMREQQYVNLAEKRPEVFKRYLKGWKTRVDNLRTMIAGIEDKKTTKQT